MKKLLVILTLSLFSPGVQARAAEKRVDGYLVISDEFDATIPKGSYVLEGKILDLGSRKVVKKVEIIPMDGEKKRTTNGYFHLTLPLEKSYVAFSKKDFQTSYFESYAMRDRHRIKIEAYMQEQGKEPRITEEKPVIYAYSDYKLNFDLTLKSKGKLTFTYPGPDANHTWHMTVGGQSLNDAAGNSYPYLFWEASHSPDFAFDQVNGKLSGEILAQANVLTYLDSVLTYMNFNAREKTDFITYWGPRLAENKYNLVQFVVQDDCSRFADYEISPKPDVFNRFYLVYSAFDRYPGFLQTEPQKLEPFERKGFDLLEWGGVCYPAYLNLTVD